MKLLFLLLSIVLIHAYKETFHGHQVVRLNIKNVPQANLVQQLIEEHNLDVWSEHLSDVRLPPHLRNIFTEHGIEQSIFIGDVQKLIDEEAIENAKRAPGDFFDAYRNTAEVNAWLDDLIKENPTLLTSSEIGRTIQGKPIRAIHLSTGGGNKPRIVYNSCLHAREWVTITTINWVLNELIIGYKAKNETIEKIVHDIDWTFIPITNIDGYDFSITNNRMWRKTRKQNPGSTCIGVDPNRNWPYMWNRGGSSTNPCSDTFHGPSAGSEPEPRAVAQYIKNTPNVKGYMDIHSYSQLFMCPWGWSTAFPPDYSRMMQTMNPIVSAIQSVHGRRYTAGSIGGILYIASGSAVDYAYGDVKILHSYTVELRDTGQYGFILPPNQIRPQGEEFMAGVIVMAEHIKNEWYSQ